MNNPNEPGIYLVKKDNHSEYSIQEWTGKFWSYVGNYVDNAKKYDEHVIEWHNLPNMIPRWDVMPEPNKVYIVKLVDTKGEFIEYAMATYDVESMSFTFTDNYSLFHQWYEDWQFEAYAPLPS